MSKQELNTVKIVEFAKELYADGQTATQISLFTHCLNAAKLAENIAHRLFNDMRGDLVPQDVNDIIAAIVNSAILSEVINTRRTHFETIADVANVQIATMVSTLSRDLRLVETKRDMEYRGRLSQSSVATQIVAVAAILCTAQEALNLLKQQSIAGIPKIRKILAQLDADLLASHATTRYYILRLYSHAARNLINDANQLIKKIRGEQKTARLLEKHTANLANKLADKEKEKKRGRKKSSRETTN
jgi:hypothetical protein